MITLFAELYIAAVVMAGAGIGLWLHVSLGNSRQLTVKFPSPLREHRTSWIAQEGHAAA